MKFCAVPRQVAGLREGHAAGGASVRAVSPMDALVSRQVAGVREGMTAGGAGVGPVADMGALVSRQVAGVREGHAAGRAGVGAVSGMGAHVFRQVAGLRGGFAADRALKNELYPRPIPPLLAQPSAALNRSTGTLIFPAPLVSVRRCISHQTYAGRLALLVKSRNRILPVLSKKKLFLRGGFKDDCGRTKPAGGAASASS